MNYCIRPAGPRSRKQQLQHYVDVSAYLLKWVGSAAFVLFFLLAGLSRNWGAMAVLGLGIMGLGVCFNLFNLRSWLPGWNNGTWFTRAISLTLYAFTALCVLLLASPRP